MTFTDVKIHHTGFKDRDLRGRKLQRDLRLLEMEREEMPDHPFSLFNLASVYRELYKHEQALPLLARNLEPSHPKDSIVPKLHALTVGCHGSLGHTSEALAVAQRGLEVHPEDDELLFLEAILLRDNGDLTRARQALERLLETEGRDRSPPDSCRTSSGGHTDQRLGYQGDLR